MECVWCKGHIDPEDEDDVGNCIGATGERPVCETCVRAAHLCGCCVCHKWWAVYDLATTRLDDNECWDCKKRADQDRLAKVLALHAEEVRKTNEYLAARNIASRGVQLRVFAPTTEPPRRMSFAEPDGTGPPFANPTSDLRDSPDAKDVVFERYVRVHYNIIPTSESPRTLWVCGKDWQKPAHECIDWFRNPVWTDVNFFVR